MSAEEWEILDTPEGVDDEFVREPVDTLVANDRIAAVVAPTGYADAKGIEVRLGEFTIIVGEWMDRPHIQVYGPDLTAHVEKLSTGRKDLPRQQYIRIKRT